jgi:hypothetical protein
MLKVNSNLKLELELKNAFFMSFLPSFPMQYGKMKQSYRLLLVLLSQRS